MIVKYIAQPTNQLGRILSELLDAKPKRVVFVSAFVGLQTIMRFKDQVISLREKGTDICFVLGIDLGGTSQEVLKELLAWNIDVRIVNHRIPGHTFHPKLYFFEWNNRSEIIIGSNNITEGGFFRNYEGCARITYGLPNDLAEFEQARTELKRFITPDGPTVRKLTSNFLKELIARNDVPTEAEARMNRDISRKPKGKKSKAEALFGIENIEPPPPLPADLLERLIKDIRRRKIEMKEAAIKGKKKSIVASQSSIKDKVSDVLLPAAFYMTLPTLQGGIPGEGRIPLEAIQLANEFWGWPDQYIEDAGKERVYRNWRPIWRVWSVETPAEIAVQKVRMYMYEDSSDFRFYVRPLVNAGADLGDVVRIRRIAQPDAEFECVLARQGTPEYDEWIKCCTQPVTNSTRRFGYA